MSNGVCSLTSVEVKCLHGSSWTSWSELWEAPTNQSYKSKSFEKLSLSISPLCPYLQRHSTGLKAVQYLCLLSPTHRSRCCSQDLFGVLRDIWVLKGYCWHLYSSICRLSLLSALSNLTGDIIFNPKTLDLGLTEVPHISNPGWLKNVPVATFQWVALKEHSVLPETDECESDIFLLHLMLYILKHFDTKRLQL